MAPKRPPPLDPNLFKGDGPLAPGSAPLPPAPDTLHPEFIIDAHTFPPSSAPTEILNGLEESYPRPTVNHIVQVKLDVSAETAEDTSYVYQPPSAPHPPLSFKSPIRLTERDIKAFAIHPTVLNLTLDTPPSIANIAKGAVDIIVPSTSPMTGKEWDLLDEAVNGLDGSWGQTTHGAEGEGGKEGQAPSSATVPGEQGKIVICALESCSWMETYVLAGLLPPPLTITSTPLFQDETYHLYQARLAQLSLHSNVYLKVLPPVVNVKEAAEEAWWNDIKELERVLRLYCKSYCHTSYQTKD